MSTSDRLKQPTLTAPSVSQAWTLNLMMIYDIMISLSILERKSLLSIFEFQWFIGFCRYGRLLHLQYRLIGSAMSSPKPGAI